MAGVFGWVRKRAVIAALEAERSALVPSMRAVADPFHPTLGENHTIGMYDGINRAIAAIAEATS